MGQRWTSRENSRESWRCAHIWSVKAIGFTRWYLQHALVVEWCQPGVLDPQTRAVRLDSAHDWKAYSCACVFVHSGVSAVVLTPVFLRYVCAGLAKRQT